MSAELRAALQSRLPLSFGVSGALGSLLFTPLCVARLVDTAREEGISIFDTSPSYGAGLAENRLGQVIGNDPDVFIMTKAGVSASGLAKRHRDHSPAGITASVEASLRRLRRERIDLLWLHGPDMTELTDELFSALERLKTLGKVGAIGIASRDPDLRQQATRSIFSAYMSPVHLNSDAAPDLISDPVHFGVECFAHVDEANAVSLNRGGIWRAAKRIVRGTLSRTSGQSAKEALDFAFGTAKCDVVVTTTTQSARIRENRAMVAHTVQTPCATKVERLLRESVRAKADAPAVSV